MTRALSVVVLRTVTAMTVLVKVLTILALESASMDPQSSQQDSTIRNIQSSSSSSSSFYTRYEHYPPYCGIPEEMQSRKIPPLQDYLPNPDPLQPQPKLHIGETRLVHVTAIIRHGARTPWSSEMKCWDGYWESPATGKWDCDDLSTFMGTPNRQSQSNANPDGAIPPMVFEKKYDALSYPDENLSNVLNGTCQMGQLLAQGYDQQVTNGEILKEAYTYRSGEYDHDERMRLLDLHPTNSQENPFGEVYFRADDYQRTILSGQIVLQSLLEPSAPDGSLWTIPLHIADEDKDIVDPNEGVCPRLKTLREEALRSPEFQAFYDSPDSQEIREYLSKNLGMGDESSILDCFMCTLCTDRPLPNSVDDYDGTDSNWYSRLTTYEIQKYTFMMNYQNAAYAKLGMGPLWYEIMINVNRVLAEDPTAPKLALFAGHDTTLMPLLASLGPDLWKDDEWASYASMMLIEIHELIDGRSNTEIYTSNFAFRLLYNGKILTPLIEGCHEDCELCDMVHLKAIVDPIATRDTDCAADASTDDGDSGTSSSTTDGAGASQEPPSDQDDFVNSLLSLSTTTGMIVFGTLVLLSGLGGSALTFAMMRRRFLRHKAVEFGGAWSMDDNDGQYGLELTEGGGNFRDT